MDIKVSNAVTGKDFDLKVESNQRISDIKGYIRQRLSLDKESHWIQLKFEGSILTSGLSVEKAGLHEGCTITWVSRRLMRVEVFEHRLGNRFSVFVTTSCKISHLKTKIYEGTLIHPFNQFLYFNGKIMKNDKSCLSDYKVFYDGSVVDVFSSDKLEDVMQWNFKLKNIGGSDLDLLVNLYKVIDIKELKNCITEAYKDVDFNNHVLTFHGRALNDEHKMLSKYYLHNKSKLSVVGVDNKAGKLRLTISDRIDGRFISLNVGKSMTLGRLKDKVYEYLGIPKEVQVLFSPLRRYENDNESLSNYQLYDGCRVYLSYQLMRLKVLFDQSGTQIPVWVNPWNTVKEVRYSIYQNFHGMIPRDQEILGFEDQVLIDQKSLFDYGIFGNMQVTCKAPISFSR